MKHTYEHNGETRNIWFSDRGLPLSYNGKQLEVPVVTLEVYCKWYEIYIINPNGEVVKAHDEYMDEYYDACNSNYIAGAAYVDHVFNPDLLHVFAKEIGGCVCTEALEMCIGRWEREVLDNYTHAIELE